MHEFFQLMISYIDNKINEQELKEHLARLYPSKQEYNEYLVYIRINKLVYTFNDFNLSPDYYKQIHKFLFNDVLENAGSYRTTNILKNENCINGHSVLYTHFKAIKPSLEYDFNEEKHNKYYPRKKDVMIKSILNFSSSIWQCHPFVEGNTRTCAVFLQKYLYTKGIILQNSSFINNATYFRNALVRANYTTDKDLDTTNEYLIKFIYSIIDNPNKILDVNETNVNNKPKTLKRS